MSTPYHDLVVSLGATHHWTLDDAVDKTVHDSIGSAHGLVFGGLSDLLIGEENELTITQINNLPLNPGYSWNFVLGLIDLQTEDLSLNDSAGVLIPDSTYNAALPISIAVWFKTSTAGPIIGQTNLNETQAVPNLYIGANGHLYGEFWTGSISPLEYAVDMRDNQWHFAVVSADATKYYLYLDGVLRATSSAGTTTHLSMTKNYIGYAKTAGWTQDPGTRHFIGLLDEISVFPSKLTDSNVLTLYNVGIAGITIYSLSNSINLYLQGHDPIPTSGTLDLTITGIPSGHTYYFKSMPLFMSGDFMVDSLNLFIKGSSIWTSGNNDINLYMNGFAHSKHNSLPLILAGGYGGGIYTANSVPLFIQGDGISDGYTPYSSQMNLFLKNVGSYRSLDLFMSGDSVINSSLDMSLGGISGSISSGLNLHMPVKAGSSRNLELFIRGYDSTL